MRDWDLIREILMRAAEKPPGQMLDANEVSGWDPLVVGAHIAMLHDANYVKAVMMRGHAIVTSAMVKEVTMQGYDLLDTLKSKTVWERIKVIAREKSIELSFDAIKTLGGLALKQIVAE